MTRRELFGLASWFAADAPRVIPVHHIFDKRAKLTPEQVLSFWSPLWSEAVRDLGRCGIRLDCTTVEGEVRRSASGRPIFTGLAPHVINVVVTDYVPINWDAGRGVAGVTTLYEGRHVCLIALAHAHPHRVPVIAVNTCVHELLHAFFHDIFEPRPRGFSGAAREFRIDWFATRLWLLHEGSMIRRAAEDYVRRLQSRAREQAVGRLTPATSRGTDGSGGLRSRPDFPASV